MNIQSYCKAIALAAFILIGGVLVVSQAKAQVAAVSLSSSGTYNQATGQVTYQITYATASGSPVTNFIINNFLPNSLLYATSTTVSGSSTPATVSANGQNITFNLGNQNAATSGTITLVASLVGATSTPISSSVPCTIDDTVIATGTVGVTPFITSTTSHVDVTGMVAGCSSNGTVPVPGSASTTLAIISPAPTSTTTASSTIPGTLLQFDPTQAAADEALANATNGTGETPLPRTGLSYLYIMAIVLASAGLAAYVTRKFAR